MTGTVKSIRKDSIFVQVNGFKGNILGRLQMIECKDYKDFDSFSRGDAIEAKVLKVSTHK